MYPYSVQQKTNYMDRLTNCVVKSFLVTSNLVYLSHKFNKQPVLLGFTQKQADNSVSETGQITVFQKHVR